MSEKVHATVKPALPHAWISKSLKWAASMVLVAAIFVVAPGTIRLRVAQEVGWLDRYCVGDVMNWTLKLAQNIYMPAIEGSGLHGFIAGILAQSHVAARENGFEGRIAAYTEYTLPQKTEAFLNVAQMICLRLAYLLLWLPAFALMSYGVLADAGALRSIRGWAFRREDNVYYNFTRQCIKALVGLLWVYLVVPISMHPYALPAIFSLLLIAIHRGRKSLQKI